MDSKYIHAQSMQLTPHAANIVSAHLFGFHCTSSNSEDYAESVAYHFLCARRTKENSNSTRVSEKTKSKSEAKNYFCRTTIGREYIS